ncbi:MAG: GGDEF domain-containing protein [Desulfobacterales bacterium]|nr:GGDEF domain-containing protein [Desulfobacterales bacterium]
MKDETAEKPYLYEILVILVFAIVITLLMGYLKAFERLIIFFQRYDFITLVDFAVFLPSFLAMGFILFAYHKIEQLQKEIAKTNYLQKELIESDKKYRELSITDDLTHLYNSRHFYNQLKAEISRAVRHKRPLSLAIMDIDNFKQHNDTYGHLEGDNVLSSLGKLINEYLRGVDSGYRYGGEEFALILPDTDIKGAAFVAERMRKGFESLTFSPRPNEKINCTISIGVAQYEPEIELKALINKADKAMYKAKDQGKNKVVLSEA